MILLDYRPEKRRVFYYWDQETILHSYNVFFVKEANQLLASYVLHFIALCVHNAINTLCYAIFALHNTQAFHNATNFTQQTRTVTFGQCTFTVNSTLIRGSCIVFQAKLLSQFLNIFIYLVESVAFWHSVKCTSVQPEHSWI